MDTDGAVSANPFISASHICISADHYYESIPLGDPLFALIAVAQFQDIPCYKKIGRGIDRQRHSPF
jgi:hypothetical protein